MIEVPVHLGIEHADLTEPVVWGVFSFLAGVGFGRYATRLSAMVRELRTTLTE